MLLSASWVGGQTEDSESADPACDREPMNGWRRLEESMAAMVMHLEVKKAFLKDVKVCWPSRSTPRAVLLRVALVPLVTLTRWFR